MSDSLPAIPLLRSDEATMDDMAALATWHEALSDSLRPDLPHDLLALWLYTPEGDPILLGPEALAQDNLDVPRLTPRVDRGRLEALTGVVQRAYASVASRPIGVGEQDVGLILLADLRHGVYGEREQQVLEGVAGTLGPALQRLRRVPMSTEGEGNLGPLVTAIAEANLREGSPKAYLEEVARALHAVVPHDRADLLLSDEGGGQCYRLGRHEQGPLWSDPTLVLRCDRPRLDRLFGDAGGAVLTEVAGAGWTEAWGGESPPGSPEEPIGSLLALRLGTPERTIGYLLLGSARAHAFDAGSLRRLRFIPGLLAPKVEGFLLNWRKEVLRAHLTVLRGIPAHLGRLAELLATQPRLGEATKLLAHEAAALLPFERMEFTLRLSEPDTVAVLEPGATLPLADLPRLPLRNTPVGRVILGEVPHLLTGDPSVNATRSVLVVPLRVAGRVIGSMTLTASGPGAFNPSDVTLARQIADLAAPHFELLRRSAVPPPATPSWRKAPRL